MCDKNVIFEVNLKHGEFWHFRDGKPDFLEKFLTIRDGDLDLVEKFWQLGIEIPDLVKFMPDSDKETFCIMI